MQLKLQQMLHIPIKKATFLSIMLALGSFSSLLFISFSSKQSDKMPATNAPVKCSRQCNNNKIPAQWNIVTGNIFKLEG
jgi:hypothetical protein